MSGIELLIVLLTVAPDLAVKVMAILQKSGHVTPEEWATYMQAKWPDANSFFTVTVPIALLQGGKNA